MTDALTHIASFKAYEHAILTCKSPKLFIIDIKDFKQINLLYGDEAGNAILRALSSKLQAFAQAQELTLFRHKNDQFILLADMPFDLSRMEKLIFTLCDVVKKQHYVYEEIRIEVQTHMGISFDHFNPLEKALKSLWVAKAEDQPFVTYSEFASTLANESEEKVETMLKNAIQEGHVNLHYQAVVDALENVCYYESLIRMECNHGLQSPKLFLKIARERHVYDLLLHAISHKIIALSQTQTVPLALNFSSFDLLDEARVSYLCDTFATTRVVFEIQCEHIEHTPTLQKVFAHFKTAGIMIALDNVDTPSIVASFEKGLIDFVKVHGDIIRNLLLDESMMLTCKDILEQTHAIGAQGIATHLNAKGAFEALKVLPFDLFQGYIFEQPHPLA